MKTLWRIIESILRIFADKQRVTPEQDKPRKTKTTKIDVLYMSQRDNLISPHQTCFPTSVAMTIRTLELQDPKARKEYATASLDNKLIADIENNLPRYKKKLVEIMGQWAHNHHPRYFYDFWKWYIENKIGGFRVVQFGAKEVDRIKAFIASGMLVVCGTKLTQAGHVVVINGYDAEKEGFICNDPYGKAPYKTVGQTKQGHDIFYSGYEWLGTNAIAIRRSM